MKNIGRIMLVLLVVVTATLLLYPTIKWYCFTGADIKQLAAGSNLQIREYSRGQASRDVRVLKERAMSSSTSSEGLDKEYKYLIDVAKKSLEKQGRATPDKWTYYSVLSSFRNEADFLSAVEAHYREELMKVKNLSGRVLNLGLDLRGGMSVLLEADTSRFEEEKGYVPTGAELTALLSEDIDVLSSRIDQFGVTEPDIRLQGTEQILIEIPGEADPERVNAFLRSSGSLTFQLVDSSLTNKVNADYIKNPSSIVSDTGAILTPSYIPEGRTLAGYFLEDEYGIEYMDSLVVLHDEVGLDGSHLVSAQVGEASSATNLRPSILFTLDAEGGNIFYKFTKAHINDSLAVVLDGKVRSVAKINSEIRDSVQLTGSFSHEEAQALTVILKSSSLPIELKVMSQQAIGATLGDDSVKVALKALVAGVLLVIVFMVAYYGLGGLVADLALLLNLYMMIALLSALNFTLTLASIAGIVLTLGMAIDANVIIYERMKEEQAAGAAGFEVIKQGFGRAFWTIMDSNITTIIAAAVLIIFGASAVKGFAVTLAVGIGCSLFTALILSHLIFDLFVTEENGKQVSLGWRRKK